MNGNYLIRKAVEANVTSAKSIGCYAIKVANVEKEDTDRRKKKFIVLASVEAKITQ